MKLNGGWPAILSGLKEDSLSFFLNWPDAVVVCAFLLPRPIEVSI